MNLRYSKSLALNDLTAMYSSVGNVKVCPAGKLDAVPVVGEQCASDKASDRFSSLAAGLTTGELDKSGIMGRDSPSLLSGDCF